MSQDIAPTSLYFPGGDTPVLFYLVSSDGYSMALPPESMVERFSIGEHDPNLHRSAFSLGQVDISDARPKSGVLAFKGKIRASSEAEAIGERQSLKLWVRGAAWFTRGEGLGGLECKPGRGSLSTSPATQDKVMWIVEFSGKVIPQRVEDLNSDTGGWW